MSKRWTTEELEQQQCEINEREHAERLRRQQLLDAGFTDEQARMLIEMFACNPMYGESK